MDFVLYLQKLKCKIQDEKHLEIHKNAEAFVFVVMSHGDAYGNLRSSDEKNLSIKDDMVSQFDGDNWPVIKGKPKIFFIQACRGGKS